MIDGRFELILPFALTVENSGEGKRRHEFAEWHVA